jgi:hypothetical protein
MPNRSIKIWILATGFVFLFSSLAMVLFNEVTMIIMDQLMYPWLQFCKALTPAEWWTLGNIPLALLVLFSGLFVDSMAISAVVIFISCLSKKLLAK